METLIRHFTSQSILVLGDVILDRYWWGQVTRISPEAPVPVVRKQRTTLAPGGAANVAANVASLNGRPLLIGLVGEDDASRELTKVLAARDINTEHLIADPDRPTTVKTRVVAHGQHVVRVDDEETKPVTPDISQRVAERLLTLLSDVRVLIISDYAKGLLTPELLRLIIGVAREEGVKVLVDPKGQDYTRYRGAAVITPNRSEAALATGLPIDGQIMVDRAGGRLLTQFGVEAALITQGEAGMTLFQHDATPLRLHALARQVYDVTGAGDTVIATLGLALSAGAPLPSAARLANLAAGLAVEQVGTAAVLTEQLRQAVLDGCHGDVPQTSEAFALSAS